MEDIDPDSKKRLMRPRFLRHALILLVFFTTTMSSKAVSPEFLGSWNTEISNISTITKDQGSIHEESTSTSKVSINYNTSNNSSSTNVSNAQFFHRGYLLVSLGMIGFIFLFLLSNKNSTLRKAIKNK